MAFEELAPRLVERRRSESPWVRFLAAVQLGRFSKRSKRHWNDAAREIDRADRLEWWMGIRSRALEALSPAEVALVTAGLISIGARPLAEAGGAAPDKGASNPS